MRLEKTKKQLLSIFYVQRQLSLEKKFSLEMGKKLTPSLDSVPKHVAVHILHGTLKAASTGWSKKMYPFCYRYHFISNEPRLLYSR